MPNRINMENIVKEIENLLWKSERKKVAKILPTVFSNTANPSKLLEMLLDTAKMLIKGQCIDEARTLLSSLKVFALTYGEFFVLTEVKNLLSFCYRLCKKYSEALQECKDSISICKAKPTLYSKLPAVYLNISAIFFEDLKTPQKAKAYAEAAYEASKKILSENPSNSSVKRSLAVSILTLGQIEESLGNKELAIMWYSQGVELKVLDKNFLGQIKLKLYEICNKNVPSPGYRSMSSRQKNYQCKTPRIKIHSKVYSACTDSLNSSFTTSSQYSTKNARLAREKTYPVGKIVKLQAWAKMLVCKKKYEEFKRSYDYFAYGVREIEGVKYLVSVFRKVTLHKKKFVRRIINPVIYVEAYPVQVAGKPVLGSYELKDLCEALGVKTSEALLRSCIKRVVDGVRVKSGKISMCL